MVLVPLVPCVTVKLLADAERLKFGRGVTVRATVVICDKLPDVPAIVMVTVPRAAVLVAVRVKVVVLLVLMGLKEAVTPLGRPEADRLTLPLKPFWGVMVIMLVPLVPWTTLRLLGEAERV